MYIRLLFLFNYNTPKNVKERGLKIVSEKIHNKGIIILMKLIDYCYSAGRSKE